LSLEADDGLYGIGVRPGLPEIEAKKPDPRQDLPQIVAGAAEERVDRVACRAFEEVPAQEAIGFQMVDLGLDGGAPSQMALEGITLAQGDAILFRDA